MAPQGILTIEGMSLTSVFTGTSWLPCGVTEHGDCSVGSRLVMMMILADGFEFGGNGGIQLGLEVKLALVSG